jgi:hypothetical protein
MYHRVVRRRLLLAGLVVGAMSLCGCGSSSAASGGAGEFARQQYERMSNGDRDKVYESLLPDQRSQDVLDAFWGCTEDVMGTLHMDTVEVADVHDASITVGGVSHRAKVVTLKITLGDQQQTLARYVVKEDGHWYAAVSDHKLEEWHHGICENP